ncbi:cell envelope integrity protein TolA [Verrucomicrobiales bacterium]|nr:cell envelope integrity protein TolA [Verrucomicrobiales bacterium]
MSNLPDLLAGVASKVRRAQWLRGIFATAASVLGGIAVIMLLDLMFPGLPTLLRALLSVIVLVVGCIVCWKYLILPLSRPLDLKGLARRIETENPELEESVSTALWVGNRSSGTLGEAVDKLAVGGLSSRKEEIAALVPTRRVGQIAAALAGVLVLALVLAPHVTSALFRRAVLPFSSGANAQAASIVVSPGDVVVTRGDALEISVTGGRGDAFFETDSGRVAMENTGEGSARFVMREVEESFTYHVAVGAAKSALFEVKVVAPPEAESFAVRVVLPEYLGGEFIAENPALVEAVVGSALVPELELPEGVTAKGADERVLLETGETQWEIGLENEIGITSRIGPLTVVVAEDQLPELEWVWPLEEEINAPPDAVLGFDVESTDDYRVEREAFFVEFDGGGEYVDVPLDLATYADRGITELSITARAWDAYPRTGEGQAQYGESSAVRVFIRRGNRDPEVLALKEQIKEATQQARQAARELDQAQRKLLDNAKRFDREAVTKEDMTNRAEGAVENLAKAESALEKVASLTASLPLDEEVNQASEGAEDASRKAAEAPLQSSADARAAASRTAAKAAESAKEQVKALEKAIAQAGDRAEQAIELGKLARKQERRVEEAEALDGGEPGAWEEGRKTWARDQRKDADALDRLQDKMERENSNAEPAATEALAAAAAEARTAAESETADDATDAARRAAASLAMAAQLGKGESGEGSSEKGDSGKLAIQPSSDSNFARLPESAISPPEENLLGGSASTGDLGAGAEDGVPPGFGAAVRAYFNSLSDE